MNFITVNNHVAIASEMMGMRLKLNQSNYELLKELCYDEWDKCKKEVHGIVGRPINLGSSKVVQSFLYTELKLKPKFKRGKGTLTADENALRELRVDYPQHREVLNALIKERHIRKKIESYIEIELDEDNYIGYAANPAGTETNRWSFSKSPRNRGLNAQTLPKVMRIMCDAPPGRIFICPDLPQADARIVAWDAKAERLIGLFNDPKVHFHLENAIRVGGLSREEAYDPKFKAEDPRYTLFKAMGHAANYRMQAKKLAMELGVTKAEAQKALDRYHQVYPEVRLWHNAIKEQLRRDAGLRTPKPFERFRTFYGAWAELVLRGKISETTWNEACAYKPQSAVADIVNVGMEKLWLGVDYVRFHKHDHDSYLASVPLDKLDEACAYALEALRVTLLVHDRPLLMLPEMSVGTNYGIMVSWKPGSFDLQSYEALCQKKLADTEHLRADLYGYY